MRNKRNIALLYPPKLTVSLLVLVVLLFGANSNDVKGNSNTGSDLDRYESSSRNRRQPDDYVAADEGLLVGDGPISSMGCFEGSGIKCPNGADTEVTAVRQSATAGIASHGDVTNVANYRARRAIDISNTAEASAATVTSSVAPPPPPPPVQTVLNSRISAVLVLTLKDAQLATLLMTSLRACGALTLFRDLFVVVPGDELAQIEAILVATNNGNGGASFGAEGPDLTNIVMVDEEQLLMAVGVDKMESSWYTYTLQMALKLLASSLMKTPFYITLDADVLCTKDRISEEDLLPQGKGNYVPEGRNMHPGWWSHAAHTLGVEENPLGEGFGVTPAVLSTSGVELAVERLRKVHGHDEFFRRIFDGWLVGGDRWWTEYTIYRTALDYFQVFDTLHAVGPTKLLGDDSVWFSEQFDAWNATAAFDEEPAAFAVVQSTAKVGISRILRKLQQGLEDGDDHREGEEDDSIMAAPGTPSSLRRRIVHQMELLLSSSSSS